MRSACTGPVFASGEDPQCPAKNVTDGQWETCWKPASTEAGQWVMVDLEGTKDVEGIHVVFRGMVQHAVEVALSHTREDFRTIYNSGERPAVTDVSLDNLGQQARFIRVRFPGVPRPSADRSVCLRDRQKSCRETIGSFSMLTGTVGRGELPPSRPLLGKRLR